MLQLECMPRSEFSTDAGYQIILISRESTTGYARL
jgi:hypothetical protein